MDKVIDARFDGVEKALANLVASISKYNPAPALAQDLVLADQELNDGLSLCTFPLVLHKPLHPPLINASSLQ